MTRSPITRAMIPAAGAGTRLLPATKVVPKELMPLIDRPVIQWAVEEAVASGVEDLLIVTSRGKSLMADHFDRNFELEHLLESRGKTRELEAVRAVGEAVRLYYTRQAEPLGIGHAVLQGASHIGRQPFGVLLPDDVMTGPSPVWGQLAAHYRPGVCVVAAMPVPRAEASRYGIATGTMKGGVMEVEHLVEKPPLKDVASDPAWALLGRYVLDEGIFDVLRDLPPGAGGEIQLTDALAVRAGEGRLLAVAFDGVRYDVGDKLGYIKAVVAAALAEPDLGPAVSRYLRELRESDLP